MDRKSQQLSLAKTPKMPQTLEERKLQVQRVTRKLKTLYPEAHIILNFQNPWELLVAVILSAQCTDVAVNKVTEKLFKKYPRVIDYVNADPKEFEQDIFSSGFYRAKTKNILSTAKMVHEQHGDIVPSTMEELLQLKGVARKTANIVLSNAYGLNVGIAVDTHVSRLSQRLGLTQGTDPKKIEQDLIAILPKSAWNQITYLLIDHGRMVCTSQRPKCDKCILNTICPSAFQFPHFVAQKE